MSHIGKVKQCTKKVHSKDHGLCPIYIPCASSNWLNPRLCETCNKWLEAVDAHPSKSHPTPEWYLIKRQYMHAASILRKIYHRGQETRRYTHIPKGGWMDICKLANREK